MALQSGRNEGTGRRVAVLRCVTVWGDGDGKAAGCLKGRGWIGEEGGGQGYGGVRGGQ